MSEHIEAEPWGDPDAVFWSARPELQHVHNFAQARLTSPWAVLGCVLARVVAHVEPNVVLPAIVGGHASLNLFVGLVGRSGSGKGAANHAADDTLDYDAEPPAEANIGSGEGINHAYMRFVPGKGKDAGELVQHTTRVVFHAAEVDSIAALKGRSGSTLLPTLRSAWSGEPLGFAYADTTRRLPLERHSYRLCLIVGIQPGNASTLLDDETGGTPQRFLWMPATDPNMPDKRPREAPAMTWHVPTALHHVNGRSVMPVCDMARGEVEAAALARARGEVDALDGHALLARLKVAAALALLSGRVEVEQQDWALAGHVMAVSNRTRAGVQRELSAVKEAENVSRGRAEGARAVAAEDVKERHAVQRIRHALLKKIPSDTWRASSDLRRALASRDRQYFDAAIEALIEAGLIDARGADYRGTPGIEYRLSVGQR